jgi:hypothetical protein
MQLYWAELLDDKAPLALRRRGLVQISGLALAVQFLHLGLAWLALPQLFGLPQWLAWAASGFFLSLLLLVGVLYFRPGSRKPWLEPARRAFLAALWLGLACLAAVFAARMGFELGVALFLSLGFAGYGAALRHTWFDLGKA